jgi:hypothetical protein
VPTIPLIATQAFAYAGKRLRVGDRFTASLTDAKLLKAIGRVTAAPSAPLRTRALVPEPILPSPPSETAADDAPRADDAFPVVPEGESTTRTKRTYRRRDLTAEN